MGQIQLMSILRWNFKTNMEKTMSCSERGLITLVYGSELAFVSLLAFENELRLPEALPCLHDKALEAVGDFPGFENENQNSTSGPFAKIIQGFKGVKPGQHGNCNESRDNLLAHLESILSRSPFSDLSFDFDLDIDDIEIEEPVSAPASLVTNDDKMTSSTSAKEREVEKMAKEPEREKLFEGGSSDSKPKMRTPDEIVATMGMLLLLPHKQKKNLWSAKRNLSNWACVLQSYKMGQRTMQIWQRNLPREWKSVGGGIYDRIRHPWKC